MDAIAEMNELARLWQESPRTENFEFLRRQSKWGERLGPEVIAKIKEGDREAIEDGILFLEVSPRYFRSGYWKARVASKLKQAPLTDVQKERLLKVILDAIESKEIGPEFSEYAHLAVLLANEDFLADVSKRQQASSGWAQRRCRRVLSLCQEHKKD